MQTNNGKPTKTTNVKHFICLKLIIKHKLENNTGHGGHNSSAGNSVAALAIRRAAQLHFSQAVGVDIVFN